MKKLFLLALLAATGATKVLAQGNTSEPPYPSAPLKKHLAMVEMGFLFQKSPSSSRQLEASPSVVIFNGYQFRQALSVGATIGVDIYESLTISPVALGIRGSLGHKRISPFYALDVGYGSAFLNSQRTEALKHMGGWMVNPSAGIKINTGNQTAFTLGVGYKRQRAITDYTVWTGTTFSNSYSFKRVSLRMGFLF